MNQKKTKVINSHHSITQQWIQEKTNKLCEISKSALGNDILVSMVLNQRYGFNHMIEFYLEPMVISRHGNNDRDRAIMQRVKQLILRLCKDLSGRTRREFNTKRLYFNDLDQFLNLCPEELWCRVTLVELLPPAIKNLDKKSSDEIAAPLVRVQLRKRPPKWKYRINLRASAVRALAKNPAARDAIRTQIVSTARFDNLGAAFKSSGWSTRYFYCDNLDWLSAALLVAPGLITNINEYQHVQELLTVDQ